MATAPLKPDMAALSLLNQLHKWFSHHGWLFQYFAVVPGHQHPMIAGYHAEKGKGMRFEISEDGMRRMYQSNDYAALYRKLKKILIQMEPPRG